MLSRFRPALRPAPLTAAPRAHGPLGILAAGLLAAGLLTTGTVGATCNQQLLQQAQQNQQQNAQAAAQQAQNLYSGHTTQPSWVANSDGMLTACYANNWPQISLSSPIMTELMNGAEQSAVKTACNEARNVIMQGSNTVQGAIQSIPGMSTFQAVSNGQALPTSSIPNWSTTAGTTATASSLLPSPSSVSGVNWSALPGVNAAPAASVPAPSAAPATTVPTTPAPTASPSGAALPGVSVR